MTGSAPSAAFWLDRPVLVTGATGLLGSWLVKRLMDLRAEVVCLVRDWVPQSELVRARLLEQVRVVRGDVRDQELVERTAGEYEVATVFHLAAQPVVGVASRNPTSTFDTNVRGTWAVLEACRRSPAVRQVIVASSDKAYGDHGGVPYDETMALQGRYPYDVSKSCADLIAQCYAATWGLPVAITRCGNLYGGGDLNWNRLVPGTIRSLLRRQRPVIRSDGTYVRDYFYVEDAAAACVLLAERFADDPSLKGQAFNFSYELELTVLDVVTRVCRLAGSSLQPDVRNEASNEVRYQRLSAQKAHRVLGWQPHFSLDEGLSRTIRWYADFFAEARDAEGARGAPRQRQDSGAPSPG